MHCTFSMIHENREIYYTPQKFLESILSNLPNLPSSRQTKHGHALRNEYECCNAIVTTDYAILNSWATFFSFWHRLPCRCTIHRCPPIDMQLANFIRESKLMLLSRKHGNWLWMEFSPYATMFSDVKCTSYLLLQNAFNWSTCIPLSQRLSIQIGSIQ